MCFRLQTVVWKFLWRDWTFHWRVAERAGASQTALCESQLPPRSPETSRGETAVRRPSSNTRMRNFVKPCPRRLGRLHKRDGPPSSRRSPRPVIEIDASVPRCWPTPATRQMSRKPTGGHYLTLHRQIFLLR